MSVLHHLLTLLVLTQSRTTNIPLFLLFQVVLHSLLLPLLGGSGGFDATEVSVTMLLLQFAGFFATGGNNAFSGVDLSSAYNGVADFNVFAVGVLVFISNWAASIWWASAGVLMLLECKGSVATLPEAALFQHGGNRDRTVTTGAKSELRLDKGEGEGTDASAGVGQWAAWKQNIRLLTVFTAASLVAVMAACTALRTHLFIWTVFSPKYLYSMAWSLGMHLGVNVALGGFLFWLGSSR